mmetsp:Transcript_4243/g.10439  ORF Transcript_4243/g.10439 Transcript_4243/m.10439 type:complete len:91 (-) Transcript_4243:220-492(-)
MVMGTNTVINPRTVMVHARDTTMAECAVLRSERPYDFARGTEPTPVLFAVELIGISLLRIWFLIFLFAGLVVFTLSLALVFAFPPGLALC